MFSLYRWKEKNNIVPKPTLIIQHTKSKTCLQDFMLAKFYPNKNFKKGTKGLAG